MKYVVLGYIGFNNFGDEAIAYVLIQKLKSAGVNEITMISSNPENTARQYDVDSCGMLNFLPSLLKSDVLISGGGSLLQDVTSLKSLIYYLIVIGLALLLGKRVQLLAQGIGPINSKFGESIAKFILRKVHEITVRDEKSHDILAGWGIPSLVVKDSVFDLSIPEINSEGFVGVQLRPFNGVDDLFLDKLSDAIFKYFYGKPIKVISLQDSMDLNICEAFAKMLINKGFSDVEIKCGLSISNVIETISSLEYLIAMRFHANVIGIKANKKILAVNYDPKVQKLSQEYYLPIINLDDNDFSYQFQKLI